MRWEARRAALGDLDDPAAAAVKRTFGSHCRVGGGGLFFWRGAWALNDTNIQRFITDQQSQGPSRMDMEDAIRRFEAVHLRKDDDELSRFQNENYHLKLALSERDLEVSRLLHRGVYVGQPLDSCEFLGSNKSESDLDVVTHFSGSPYKGKRTDSKATESSVATTTMSAVKAEQQAFKRSVVPFLERMVNTLQTNSVFKSETEELAANFAKFRNSPQDTSLLTEVLDDVLYYSRQTTAILNRELKFKELSQRLEYLFAIFLDPKQYNMDPQEHIEYLREEITDTMIKIFHHRDLPPEYVPRRPDSDPDEFRKYAKSRETCNYRGSDWKLKGIEQGFDICANAMNQAFGDKKKLRPHETIKPRADRIPVLSDISNSCHKEKQWLKENKRSLEFMPIGYDESVLNAKTPQRQTQKSSSNSYEEFTPKANEENDSLQMFIQEQASYRNSTAGRSRK